MKWKMLQPDFSVIIATYNRANLLPRAMLSLLKQTAPSWECIVVDDGSNDNTREIVEGFIRVDSRIRYIFQENKGESEAKNSGAAIATGRYITFLDSDDEYEVNHLESRWEILKQDYSIQLLHGGVRVIGDSFVPDISHPGKHIHLSECVIGGTFFIEANTMKILKGFVPMAIGSDADLFSRANKANIVIQKTDIPTYIYHRELPDSITKTYRSTKRV